MRSEMMVLPEPEIGQKRQFGRLLAEGDRDTDAAFPFLTGLVQDRAMQQCSGFDVVGGTSRMSTARVSHVS